MYQLFSEPRRQYSGLISDFVLNNIEKRTVEDVNRVIEYYRYGTFFTQNDHLLVKLINTIGTPLSYDLEHYHEVTLARSLYAANTLKLTSSINFGQWHVGVFYYNCPEIIIAYNGDSDPKEMVKDWRNLQPVKVLESPISNMRYLIPNGNNNSSERGLVVIGIDLPMLMVQYRCFIENERLKLAQGIDTLLTKKHFVGKYVLPNMLYSQTDIALFNRLNNLQTGAPMGEVYKKHPFYITDYTSQLDKNLDVFIKRLENTSRGFDNYIEQLPKFFNDAPLRMPDMAETRQVWWALYITRMKAINFLLSIAGERGIQANRQWIARMKIDIKQFNSDHILEKVLPENILQDIKYLFRQVMAM